MENRKNGRLSSKATLIALLPIILVLLLLNTGILQSVLPAVSVGGSKYAVTEFQYYFYMTYYDFVNANAGDLSSLGLDVTKDLDKQNYNETKTWKEYFSDEALNDLAEDTALLQAAERAGFQRDEEVNAACQQRRADLIQYCMDNGIDGLENYFRSYYKKGMTEDKYFELYGNQTLANLYREVVKAELIPEENKVTALAKTMKESMAATVNVIAVQFVPALDRTSGLAEEQQWSNAEQLAQAFLDRWISRGAGQALFADMEETYGEDELYGFTSGTFLNAFADEFDPEVASWCFDESRGAGDVTMLRGNGGWWVLYYIGQGDDGRMLLAEQALKDQAYEQWLTQQQESYNVVTYKLGMALAL